MVEQKYDDVMVYGWFSIGMSSEHAHIEDDDEFCRADENGRDLRSIGNLVEMWAYGEPVATAADALGLFGFAIMSEESPARRSELYEYMVKFVDVCIAAFGDKCHIAGFEIRGTKNGK